MSDCIPHLSISHSPVFLLNSCLDLFSAPSLARRDPLSRSYRVNLPSSLTVNHSSALVYSTRLRVSVYGTGSMNVKLSGFSRQHDYLRYRSTRRFRVLSGLSSEGGFACPPHSLRLSTSYSVRTRKCHGCVATSPFTEVAEY